MQDMYRIAQLTLKLDGVITEFSDIYAPLSQMLMKEQECSPHKHMRINWLKLKIKTIIEILIILNEIKQTIFVEVVYQFNIRLIKILNCKYVWVNFKYHDSWLWGYKFIIRRAEVYRNMITSLT